MKAPSAILAVLFGFGLSVEATTYSGAYGHTFQGYAQAIGPISNFQNGSNLGSPMAVIGSGPELWTDFNDVFGTPWHISVDLLDNYQVVLRTDSSNPSGNISGGTVGFNLYDFDFQIQDFQPVTIPPYMDVVAGLNGQNIWIGFGALGAWAPYNTYVFQIVPAPEPGTLALVALGVGTVVLGRRRLR